MVRESARERWRGAAEKNRFLFTQKNGEEEEERRKEAEVKMARHCVEYGGVKLITQGDGNPRRWLSAPHHMNVLVSNERNGTGTAL